MPLLSPTVSFSRYQVEGRPIDPASEAVLKGLKSNLISDIDGETTTTSIGWTSFGNPFKPFFDDLSFVYGSAFLFSMRIDKKSISSKIIQKAYHDELNRRSAQNTKGYLTQNEKKVIKEDVINKLSIRIPATPHIFEVLWQVESESVLFFSLQKSSRELFEQLFFKSFHLPLILVFPYTKAVMMSNLSDAEKDVFQSLSATKVAG